jgi:hypothetical protein
MVVISGMNAAVIRPILTVRLRQQTIRPKTAKLAACGKFQKEKAAPAGGSAHD